MSFESGLCYYLLDILLELLEKSSWEGVCSVHSPICALEVNTNRLVGIRTEQNILSLSCIDHNQNLIGDTQSYSVLFTLSQDETH